MAGVIIFIVKPSDESKAFEFGASVTGHLQAHGKKCGSEASIEYEAPGPAMHKAIVSCKHCNITVSFNRFIRFYSSRMTT
ncbi:MAG: hypothetical protein DMG15_18330 [Acidobacteria bacterium]|nr:MAG: hypothetical protein DMG15_18330 [Acidobacteriota bacterium]